MPIPSYQDLMLPLLQALEKSGELHRNEYSEKVGDLLNIPEDERKETLPSGNETYLRNRCGWAGWYMQQAGLVEKPKRGCLRITEEGRKLLDSNPAIVDNKVLAQYPSFVERVIEKKGSKTKKSQADQVHAEESEQTPDERIEEAHTEIMETLQADILEGLGKVDPYRFEQIVIDVLFAMGYGGSRAEAAQVTKRSNDGGIDGVINEDRLGLDVIYVQAKRWQGNVGRIEVQNFVGALAGKQANKGVFITTSDFNTNALEFAKTVPQKVILINGLRLAMLMIEHGVGVSVTHSYQIKEIDSDYFE